MFHRFQYESAYYEALSRVPLDVRRKLDVTGIKISLKDWLAFSFEERNVLCHLPIEIAEERRAFTAYLDFLLRRYRGAPPALTEPMDQAHWENGREIPRPVADKSRASSTPVTAEEWSRWRSDQRYALYKTAISKSEPQAFFEVLKELRASPN
jgi:hypothetical protein